MSLGHDSTTAEAKKSHILAALEAYWTSLDRSSQNW